MKKYFYTIILLFASLISFAQTRYCSKINGETIIRKTYLTISYSAANFIPNYVAYYVTPNNLSGYANREGSFYTETSLPKNARAYTSDYVKSGYDRGHMSPAANWKYEQDAMHESFSMANICPQNPTLNRVYWREAEDKERYYARNCDTLYVVTGSICQNDGKYINNKIKVPTYFYKTCVGVHNHKVIVSVGWLYKNVKTKQTTDDCMIKIKDIEKLINADLYKGFWFNNICESKLIK